MSMTRMIGRAGVAGVALAVVVGASSCNGRERSAERREPVRQVQQAAGSGQSPTTDIKDATADQDLAEIDALLGEIDADLRQADLDVATDEGDVQ